MTRSLKVVVLLFCALVGVRAVQGEEGFLWVYVSDLERRALEGIWIGPIQGSEGRTDSRGSAKLRLAQGTGESLVISEKVLGPEHPDTARSLNNLGGLLCTRRESRVPPSTPEAKWRFMERSGTQWPTAPLPPVRRSKWKLCKA